MKNKEQSNQDKKSNAVQTMSRVHAGDKESQLFKDSKNIVNNDTTQEIKTEFITMDDIKKSMIHCVSLYNLI